MTSTTSSTAASSLVRVMRCAVLAALACVVVPMNASAQGTDSGFIRGLAGVTFGSETGGVAGGGFGVTLTPLFDVIGEVGYKTNVLPKDLQEDLDDVIDLLSILTGVPITVDVKVPAFYGFGGARVNVPSSGAVRPFVEGGLGFARISFDVDAEAAGLDFSDEIEAAADIDDETKLLLALGGGVNLGVSASVGVDVGYRYVRIFTDDPAINTSVVYAGLKFGF